MAQIFPEYANTLARVSLFGAVALPVVILYSASWITRSGYNTGQNNPIEQPIPFSHKHHALELGIDCRYCHTVVEKSPFAGVPPTHTCMSCHSQIWTNSPLLEPLRQSLSTNTPIQWERVNQLPDFVYFNHSIHIQRGINCNVCHGPVQEMQLTFKGKSLFMEWCLACHRDPAKAMYADPKAPGMSPAQQVFNLYAKAQMNEELTPREEAILSGHGDTYTPTETELKEGEALLKSRKVDKAQLMDCWTCHR